MPYIGNPIYQSAFVVDQFSGNGSTTAFTMSVAPAGVTNVLVAVSGVLQDPSTYGVVGNTLTFTAAPPSGTGNISCRYLGVPASGVTTTAYRTVTEFTATASQTTFTPPSYTVGFINVYLNGVLLGSADYTATNGTTVVLATGASAGNLVTVESFLVSSVLNAIPNTAGSVGGSNLAAGSVNLASSTVTGVLPIANGGTGTTAGVTGFKNRIINGDMVIAQRGTSSLTVDNGNWYYPVDRFSAYQSVASSKYTIQQNAGSVTPPTGFNYYIGATVTSAYSPTGGDWFPIRQTIEGFNWEDLLFGTANAKTFTASFWVRSSLTGVMGGAFYNNDGSRSYPFTYTISAANTWEFKTITVAGDTSGTWNATNLGGITISWSMGIGSTYSGTAGAWASAFYASATGATNIVATNGATLYIAGVQIEVGSQATNFDVRDYGSEFTRCQRYFQRCTQTDTTGSNGNFSSFGWGSSWGGSTGFSIFYNPPLRAAPSITFSAASTFARHAPGIIAEACSGISTAQANAQTCTILPTGPSSFSAGIGTVVTPSASATATISSNAEL